MAPGPKKKSFHTPRNAKNAVAAKTDEKQNVKAKNEVNKAVDSTSSAPNDCDTNQKGRYSNRTVENNWNKYEEPANDPHADSLRGRDFNVLLSYSGGSGSQLKLQDEKDWEDEYTKEMSLDIPDLINAMKCIPFHERVGLQNIFDEKVKMDFIESSKKYSMTYNAERKTVLTESKDLKEVPIEPTLNIVEEPDSAEPDDIVLLKNVVVQDKTEDIINSLASNLSFKNFTENEEKVVQVEPPKENKETVSNDLDFLLSLNISSKVSPKEENTVTKTANVDDWLNSILDD